jgi:hypothetical protein
MCMGLHAVHGLSVMIVSCPLLAACGRDDKACALNGCRAPCSQHLEGMTALRTLVLSFNEIAKMEGLQELTALRRLELDHNSIRRIDGMKVRSYAQPRCTLISPPKMHAL